MEEERKLKFMEGVLCTQTMPRALFLCMISYEPHNNLLRFVINVCGNSKKKKATVFCTSFHQEIVCFSVPSNLALALFLLWPVRHRQTQSKQGLEKCPCFRPAFSCCFGPFHCSVNKAPASFLEDERPRGA